MTAQNTTNGKAFEYACLNAISERLEMEDMTYDIVCSNAYYTAKAKFESLPNDSQNRYMDAARAAAAMIFPLEPQITRGLDPIILSVNADSAAMGVEGDVRDVLCIKRKTDNDKWEIGLSCKHNHEALKHPRITQDKDFGVNWVGIPNSKTFIDDISTTIDTLQRYTEEGCLWRDIAPTDEEKWDRYYVPILDAYKNEIIRMCTSYPDVPKRLLFYFFGSKDFYKVIMKENQKTTTIEGFNMNNTLGCKWGTIRPLIKVPVINMPTRLIEADYKKDSNGNRSKTTLILVFDGGWTVSMRLHNKDSRVKLTGLAWDVQLVGLPTGTYVNTRPWYE